MPIAALANPLEGTFDLSKRGTASNYLSISTGYRKRKIAENAEKLEVWIALRFLIEKELKTTASHFKGIFGSWPTSAPVGIFWTWGGAEELSDFEDLTTHSMDELESQNMYELAKRRNHPNVGGPTVKPFQRHLIFSTCAPRNKKFHIYFGPSAQTNQ